MPVHYRDTVGKHGRVGLWHIAEPIATLRALWPKEVPVERTPLTHPRRQREHLASRLLLLQLAVSASQPHQRGVSKTKQGVPYLLDSGYSCSLSHDWPYAAALLLPGAQAGIDIAVLDTRAFRVGARFLCKAEQTHCSTPHHATLYWAAKEATYKCFKGEIKDFTQLQVLPPGKLLHVGYVYVKVSVWSPAVLCMRYVFFLGYVVVYGPLPAACRP